MIVTNIFSSIFKSVAGWDITEFRFYDEGKIDENLPFSNWRTVTIITIVYLSSVYGFSSYMKSRKPLNLKPLFAVHNIILSFCSLVLLILLLETLIPLFLEHGFFWLICDAGMFAGNWGRRLELYYYINYLFKFYELFDTFFMVLSKKNIEFLHIYHHSATYWLCFTQLRGNTSVQWFVILLNLFVHVVMYYYYARTALGANIWWKKYLTTLQITQFVLDITICYYCTVTHYSGLYVPGLFGDIDCHGTPFAAGIGCIILTSYLGLFIKFFFDTYNSKRPSSVKKGN